MAEDAEMVWWSKESEAWETLCCIKTKLAKNGMEWNQIQKYRHSCHLESDHWPIFDGCY